MIVLRKPPLRRKVKDELFEVLFHGENERCLQGLEEQHGAQFRAHAAVCRKPVSGDVAEALMPRAPSPVS